MFELKCFFRRERENASAIDEEMNKLRKCNSLGYGRKEENRDASSDER